MQNIVIQVLLDQVKLSLSGILLGKVPGNPYRDAQFFPWILYNG